MSKLIRTADLVDKARGGDRAALARLLSHAERGGRPALEAERALSGAMGETYAIGVTGAPGAGKSTLVAGLLSHMRAVGETAAVLAVDPSSPLTHGALLGDRLRMETSALDDGVFIRSLATRGHSGGLSRATRLCLRIFGACGWPWTLIETVGIGQVEVEIAGLADTVIVVVTPGWGDEVQASKAGLMEVADIFVVNKADRAGARQTRRDLESMLMGMPDHVARPRIVETVATTGVGLRDLWQAIVDHRALLECNGALARRRKARLAAELRGIMEAQTEESIERLSRSDEFAQALERLSTPSGDVAAEAAALLRRMRLGD